MRCFALKGRIKAVNSTSLGPEHLVMPLFVLPGRERCLPSKAIEGVELFSADALKEPVERALSAGVRNFLLFGHYEEGKDNDGTPASDPKGPVQTALRLLTSAWPEALFFTHVSLSHASSHGFNVCLDASGKPDIKKTRRRFLDIAASHLEAGAHGIVPLFLEKGFVRVLRKTMDETGFAERYILSYGAKYDSALYGPFNASTSITEEGMPSEQIDPTDIKSALEKAEADLTEGASALIVKPALPYLDIIARLRSNFDIPLIGWMVSGEYMMVKSAAQRNICDERRTFLELHRSIFRAGSHKIITYDAVRVAGWLREDF